jgi:hypothetical protein
MTDWGGFSYHMRVGLEWWTDGYDTNTPSINVYVRPWVQVDSSWNFNDSQTVTLSGSVGGSWTFQNTMGANGTAAFGPAVIGGQGQNYGGGPVYTVTAVLSGIYLGPGGNGTASVTSSFALPARPPNVPTNPGVAVDSVTATSARVVVFASDGRGAAVDAYQTAISLPGGNWGGWSQSWFGGTGTATGLQPNTYYECAAQAHNWVGWSGWTYSSFTTAGTAPSVPLNLAISNLTQTGARAAWSAPSNNGGVAISNYTVQLATNSGFTAGLQTITDNASPNDFTGLTPNTQYWVRVRANNSIGSSAYTTAVSFRTPMVVNASGPSGTQAPFQTITLLGSDANDATVSTRTWSQVSGPAVTLTGTTTKTCTFYAPGTLSGTTLVFRYSVKDTSNVTVTSDISIPIRAAKHRAVIGGVEVPMDFRAA